jgi:hypothetical protein
MRNLKKERRRKQKKKQRTLRANSLWLRDIEMPR